MTSFPINTKARDGQPEPKTGFPVRLHGLGNREKARVFMAKVAKRRGRYVLDYYDDQNQRARKALPDVTTLKKAK